MSRHGHRFFLKLPLTVGSRVTLPRRPSRQIGNVLRLQPADQIRLFNGDGAEYYASIVEITRSEVTAQVERSEPGVELPRPPIHLALAMIKSDRFEWALQKITELGVSRIIPMVTEHSVISLRVDREERRQQRWGRIAIEAAEQSGRRDVPVIDQVRSFADVIEDRHAAQLVLLWEDDTTTPLTMLALDPGRPVVLMIGPEGGFSSSEVETARAAGITTASLGRLTLRSETAAVSAVAMLIGQNTLRTS